MRVAVELIGFGPLAIDPAWYTATLRLQSQWNKLRNTHIDELLSDGALTSHLVCSH